MAEDIATKANSNLTKVQPIPVSRKASLLDGSLPDPSSIINIKETTDDVRERRLKTGGQADARKGVFGGEEQTGVAALLHEKFRTVHTFGSRMVGGKEPKNHDQYNKYEAVSYITPDTHKVEQTFLKMTPGGRSRQQILLWIRYAITGMVVSIVIAFALRVCGVIEKTRVKYTTKALDKGDIMGGWLIWVGSSVGMNLIALFLVLLQPAAASSGIPGLIAYLNGKYILTVLICVFLFIVFVVFIVSLFRVLTNSLFHTFVFSSYTIKLTNTFSYNSIFFRCGTIGW